MRIKDFKYVFVETGGGWGYVREMYGVTSKGELYTTSNFDERNIQLDTEIECEFICKFDDVNLGMHPVVTYAVMDATSLATLEVTEEELVEVQVCPCIDCNNPELFNRIQKAVYAKNHS